ncbi:MAG: L-histidine N(alpha)-methyltransferase [Bacteroidota bacterium]
MNISSPAITELSTFAVDVEDGLSRYPKQISSKYFYDEQGDLLFQEIMAMPEYYLTNCEYEIFSTQKEEILDALGTQAFDLIELGAGDGTKTKVLLEHFLKAGADFTYRPIDISPYVLKTLEDNCATDLPTLDIQPVAGDYLKALHQIQSEYSDRRKVILFLGGNIGNFPLQKAQNFIQNLAQCINSGDMLLTGFDLKKDPALILDAYNDATGITAAFNLNLLSRINRELGGEFDLDTFIHWESYNPLSGEARSYIVSKVAQTVNIDQLQLSVHFDAWEPIAVEVSAKYNQRDIAELAQRTGFSVKEHFTDSRAYFVDSLWELS